MELGTDYTAQKRLLLGVIYFIFLILLTRMLFIQGINHEKYKMMSENNRLKENRIDSERGKIYDRNGRLLVTNGTGFRLLYLKGRSYRDEDIEEIARVTGLDKKFIERKIKYGELATFTKEVTITDNLDEEVAHRLKEQIEEDSIIKIDIYSKRRYLYDKFASHLLGYVKKISENEFKELRDKGYNLRDYIGKDGIEKTYDTVLKGKAGKEKVEVNAYNRINKILDKKKPENGKNLYLSISYELQNYMENLLKEGGYSGSVITINPKTGNIITMVSYPTYSLEMFSTQISHEEWDKIINNKQRPLHNKSIAGQYPPGSIYKPISALAFLNRGLNPNEKFFDPGYYEIGKQRWRAWKHGGHGSVDLEKSLIESANPYYYRLADQHGHGVIHQFARNFGLGENTGIDIPGERPGINPSPDWKMEKLKKKWFPGDTINMSIGQGYVLVTPMQMVQAYSVLANKGYAYKPMLLKYIGDDKEKPEREILLKINEPIKNFDLITNGLRKAVEQDNGTTKILRTKGVSIAAKSGSAQNSHSKETHAWVAGYFPIENPEVVFVVLLEGAGGGGKMAGGVAKQFIDKYLELKENGTFIVDEL